VATHQPLRQRTAEQPAYSNVPPGVLRYPGTSHFSWRDQPLEQRQAEARRLLEEAGFGPSNPLQFELKHRNSGDNPRVAVVVQADQDARTGLVVQVMDQARLAGVHDVALAATAGAL
jgi:ABC-type oligopeptide transport system substrate-binding subunit